MASLIQALPDEARARLRSLARPAEFVDWPAGLARRKGWRVANEAYQNEQRRLGELEMRALLMALGLQPPLEPSLALDAILTAIDLYFHTAEVSAEVHPEDGTVRVDVTRCPVFERMRTAPWGGLATCGCFARRRGWYKALDTPVDEELVMFRNWGDPVCELVIRVPAAVSSAA